MEKRNIDELMEECAFLDREVGIPLSFKAVKEYFDYSDEFWTYFDSHSKTIPFSKEALDYYGIFVFKEKEIVPEFIITIPKVENLFTARVAVHEIKHAHDLYERLNKPYNLSDDEYEERARQEEKKFKNYYIDMADDKYESDIYPKKEVESITKFISFYNDQDKYLGDYELGTKNELIVPDNTSSMTLGESITYTTGEMSYNISCEYFIKDRVRVLDEGKVMLKENRRITTQPFEILDSKEALEQKAHSIKEAHQIKVKDKK